MRKVLVAMFLRAAGKKIIWKAKNGKAKTGIELVSTETIGSAAIATTQG